MLELNKIYQGDALEVLKTLPSESVDCVITSPPYWGLRDYGTAEWEGGDEKCEHNPQKPDGGDRSDRTLPLGRGGLYKAICGKCGAVRRDFQLGLEKTPEEYVAKLVEVFREVRRVLKKEGTAWLNLGDSYAGSGCGTNDYRTEASKSINKSDKMFTKHPPQQKRIVGLKSKDLVGIPWRVAFALQADGWYLRQDLIWAKSNPMPESVTDRCTKSHEYIFLLTKSRRYFYDAEAVKEKANYDGRKDEMFKGAIKSYEGVMPNGQPQSFAQKGHERWQKDTNGNRIRNRRSVWTIPTQPFSGAHFAVFPEALIEPMIKAGTSERGVCSDCGKPWERVVETNFIQEGVTRNRVKEKGNFGENQAKSMTMGDGGKIGHNDTITLGWRPTCACGIEPVPAVILDPFIGSGTVGVVARKLKRNFIGIELSPKYCKMAEARIKPYLEQKRFDEIT